MKDAKITMAMLDEYFSLLKQFNDNMIRKFGFLNKDGTITLYRGVSKKYFDDSGIAFPSLGDSGQLALNSAESWSTSATSAKGFTGTDWVILQAKFKADEILYSPFSFDNLKYSSESEFVVGGANKVNYRVIWKRGKDD